MLSTRRRLSTIAQPFVFAAQESMVQTRSKSQTIPSSTCSSSVKPLKQRFSAYLQCSILKTWTSSSSGTSVAATWILEHVHTSIECLTSTKLSEAQVRGAVLHRGSHLSSLHKRSKLGSIICRQSRAGWSLSCAVLVRTSVFTVLVRADPPRLVNAGQFQLSSTSFRSESWLLTENRRTVATISKCLQLNRFKGLLG
jgi:hypothetical protein